MKIEAEIVNVRTSKKGDTMTVFIPKEHRDLVVKGIMPFLEKPVTIEVLIDTKKVIEQFDRITDEQRAKAYAVLNDFAREYGDTTENVKAMLKTEFMRDRLINNFSLSDCSKEQVADFIEYVINQAKELDYGFAASEGKSQAGALYANNKCFVCYESGKKYQGPKSKVCLCDNHYNEMCIVGVDDFVGLYHIDFI